MTKRKVDVITPCVNFIRVYIKKYIQVLHTLGEQLLLTVLITRQEYTLTKVNVSDMAICNKDEVFTGLRWQNTAFASRSR